MKIPRRALALALPLLAGCYTFVPVGIDDVAPGQNLRARITPAANEGLPPAVRSTTQMVEGEVLLRDGPALTLFLPVTVRQEGFFSESLHERVLLSSTDLMEVELKELSRSRTYAATGIAGALVAALAVRTFNGKTGGNTIDRTDQGPSASFLTVFRLLLR